MERKIWIHDGSGTKTNLNFYYESESEAYLIQLISASFPSLGIDQTPVEVNKILVVTKADVDENKRVRYFTCNQDPERVRS